MVWNFWPTGILSQSLTVRLVLNYARACHGMTILNTSRTVGRGQFLGLSRKFQDSWRVWGYIHWTFCYRVANCCSYSNGCHKGTYVRSLNVALHLLQSAITNALLYGAELTVYISFSLSIKINKTDIFKFKCSCNGLRMAQTWSNFDRNSIYIGSLWETSNYL